jgi:S-DNA-T family DNA segregation ATPase FtsK/SpoIIIE
MAKAKNRSESRSSRMRSRRHPASQAIERSAFQRWRPQLGGPAVTGAPGAGLDQLLATAAARWRDAPAAEPIRLLPFEVAPDELPGPAADPAFGVAVGLEEHRLAPARVDLAGADPHLLVLGDGESGKTTLLRWLLRRLTARHGPEHLTVGVVDYRRGLAGDLVGLPQLLGYAATPAAATALAATLATAASGRLPSDSTLDPLTATPWSGPRLLLVVDDYDLVAGAAGNPLAGLVDLLAHGRDVGLHLVLARRTGGIGRAAFEPLLQRLRELDPPALVLRGDPSDGPVLGGIKLDASLPPGRAQLARRHDRPLVQLVHARAPEPQGPPG